jgi:hypothetical protein
MGLSENSKIYHDIYPPNNFCPSILVWIGLKREYPEITWFCQFSALELPFAGYTTCSDTSKHQMPCPLILNPPKNKHLEWFLSLGGISGLRGG